MAMHGFINNVTFEVVKDIVVILGLFGFIHKVHKLILESLPTDFDTFQPKLRLGPLLQFDIHSGVEGSFMPITNDFKVVIKSIFIIAIEILEVFEFAASFFPQVYTLSVNDGV
jgi:hypothetical protein